MCHICNIQYMASRYVWRCRIAVMNVVVTFHPMICSGALELFSLFITRMTCFRLILYYILTYSLCLNLYYWQYKIPNILLCITIFRMSLYCPTTGIIPLVLWTSNKVTIIAWYRIISYDSNWCTAGYAEFIINIL